MAGKITGLLRRLAMTGEGLAITREGLAITSARTVIARTQSEAKRTKQSKEMQHIKPSITSAHTVIAKRSLLKSNSNSNDVSNFPGFPGFPSFPVIASLRSNLILPSLAGIFALSLLFLLSSCDNQDAPDNRKPEIPTGEMVAVKFTVGGLGFEDNEVNTRSARTTADEPPVTLRVDTIPLNTGIKVRVVVYTGQYTGYTDYTGHADYEVTVGGLLTPYPVGGDELWAPLGASCKFVAYSFNETTPMPSFASTTILPFSTDVLWGDTIETVNLGTHPVHITMQHLMAKVVVRGKADYLYSLNSVDAGILCYDPTLTVNTGVLNPNGSPAYRPVPWIFANPADSVQVSDTMYVFTDAAATTSLIINQVSVNSVLFTGPYYVNYAKPLEAGNIYTLDVRFSPQPVGGSTARITWEPPSSTYLDGRYVITYDPRDAGLYFQFGSVVGLFSAPGGQIQSLLPPIPPIPSSPAFDLTDIAWSPVSTSGLTWTTIPSVSTDLIDSVFHTAVNVKAGLGDPCRLVGLDLSKITPSGSLTIDDIDNGVWRLPTDQENCDFSGWSSNQNSGDWWWAANAFGNISFGVAGGEFPQRGTGGMNKFLPAAGCRRDNSEGTDGLIMYQGSNGYYWSNENRSVLYFINNSYLFPAQANRYTGCSVRCVKQKLSIDVSGTVWEDGGELNPNANTIL